jgi:hypothetical protein
MSEAALDTLDRVATELRAAMESGESDRITDAVTAFAPALEAVRGIGVWHVNDQFKARIAALRTRFESHHMLARLLGDLTTQRLDLLAGAAASPAAPLVYRRRA